MRTTLVVKPTRERIAHVLETARQMLDMEVAYLADTRDGFRTYAVVGEDGPIGAPDDEAVLFERACGLAVLRAQRNDLTASAGMEPTSGLAIAERLGEISCVGVPVVLCDGEVFGTFCCLGRQSHRQVKAREIQMMEFLGQLIADQLDYEQVEDERRTSELATRTITTLVAALEARDGYTEAHSEAVAELAVAIGHRLGIAGQDLADLQSIALLHDIGKLGIPDSVLRKPGPLDADEWVQMRRHPEIGAVLVSSMQSIAHLAPAIRAGHERWDGKGYPDELTREQIPVAARIVLIADAFHAMTSPRPYRAGLSPDQACIELEAHTGTQFWPEGVSAALEILAPRARARASWHEDALRESVFQN